MDPFLRETVEMQNLLQKIPSDTVKSLTHIQFVRGIAIKALLLISNKVSEFLGNRSVIRNNTTRNKTILEWRNQRANDQFDSVSEDLRNEFIDDIAQANRSKVVNDSTETGFPFFGMRAIKVLLTSLSNLPELRKERTAEVT